jgi:SAM-dependent methyltransferase
MRACWCGKADLLPFGLDYGECRACGTLVYLRDMPPEQLLVRDDETDFYGKKYWLEHQHDAFGYPDIHTRARNDLTERNLHWLKALLKYRLPPAKVLELGCAHGSFVALLRQAGYDASGVEMSSWVVEFGQKTFGVPISIGPVEALEIPLGSLDVIALMDVLEHLPDPAATMVHCLKLLKPDGLLLIQTPQFKKGMNYKALVKKNGAFLEQLKADEHIYLFSDRSVTRLFQQLGAKHIRFEPAIFGHYDMFLAVSRGPLANSSTEEIEAALTATPNGHLTLALLDIYARESAALAQLQADKDQLVAQLRASEADRTARLEVIETQGQELGKIPQLEAEKEQLIAKLQASESDRAARLEVIEAQGQKLGRIPELEAEKKQLIAQLQASEADRAGLYANRWVRIGIKTRLVSTEKA